MMHFITLLNNNILFYTIQCYRHSFSLLLICYRCVFSSIHPAVTLCKLWAIERNVFQGILIRAELMRLKENAELLKRYVLRVWNWTETTVRQKDSSSSSLILEQVQRSNGRHSPGCRAFSSFSILYPSTNIQSRNQGLPLVLFIFILP